MLPDDLDRPVESVTPPEYLTPEDPSHGMDMVAVFSETGAMAEMEALSIQGILEASGIPFTVFGNSTLPVTEFSVQVPVSRLTEAQKVIADAQAAGPAAAEQAEREGELSGLKGEI
jgi:hypothetical protein